VKNRKIIFGLAGILAILWITGVYQNHWKNPFHFDDFHTIRENMSIRTYDPIKYFSDPLTFGSNPANSSYRPLFVHSVALDYKLAGGIENVFYFHLHNFLGHLLLCILLFFLYRHLIKKQDYTLYRSWTALAAALLFGVLTFHAETINYISSRSDSLNALWLTLAFFIFVRYPQHRRYGLYLLPFIISFWHKQTSIVFPILIGGYLWFFERDKSGLESGKSFSIKAVFTTLKYLMPVILITILLYIQQAVMTPPAFVVDQSRYYYLISQPFVILRYFATFFLPLDLSVDTDWQPLSSMADFRFLLGTGFLILICWIILHSLRVPGLKLVGFGLFWFIICLLPTSSIFPLSEVMNDHRVYLSNLGLILALVGVLYYFFFSLSAVGDQVMGHLHPAFWFILLLFIIGNSYGTRVRNKVWSSDEKLWKDAVIKSPRNGRGLMNYGIELQRKGDYNGALGYYNEALKYSPYYSYLHANLAILKWTMEASSSEIEEHFKKSIEYNYNSPEPYALYATYLLRTNRPQEAAFYVDKGLKLSPYHEGLIKMKKALPAS